MREEQKERRWRRWSRMLLGGLVVGVLLGGHARSVMAAERIVLLRMRSDGSVVQINPASHVRFKDLDRYLQRRLEGKRVLEIKLQEHAEGCDQVIVIRYED